MSGVNRMWQARRSCAGCPHLPTATSGEDSDLSDFTKGQQRFCCFRFVCETLIISVSAKLLFFSSHEGISDNLKVFVFITGVDQEQGQKWAELLSFRRRLLHGVLPAVEV